MSSRKLSDLSDEMHLLADEFLSKCHDANLDIFIICTYRNNQEQNAAFARKDSGARAGESAHNCLNSMKQPAARAFDVGVIRNGKYVGNGSDTDYLAAGAIGESLGLVWAGRWRGKIKETGHFELPNWRDA